MSVALKERTQFDKLVRCAHCGAAGSQTWDEIWEASTSGPQAVLLRMSPEFSERLSNRPPYDIEFVCRKCGTVLVD